MAILEAFLVMLAFFGGGAVLARLARRSKRPWPVVGAALLGPEDVDADQPDLRFATFVTALATVLVLNVVYLAEARALGAVTLPFLWAISAPVLGLAQAAIADLSMRYLPAQLELTRFTWGLLRGRRLPGMGALLDEAQCEVTVARGLVSDPGLLAALDTLDEAVGDYARAVEQAAGEAELKDLRDHIQGVTELARACLDDFEQEINKDPATTAEVSRWTAALGEPAAV